MGAKMYELMDRDMRAHQDRATRVQNGISIVLGFAIGIGSSWLIWREISRILELDAPILGENYDTPGPEEENDTFVLDDR